MNLSPRSNLLPAPTWKATAWFLPHFALLAAFASQQAFAAAAFDQFVDPHPAVGNGFGETVVALSTGNVVVTSPGDDTNGNDTGAVYLFNGATGALISELRGSTVGDRIGSNGVTALTNGNYLVASPGWDNAAAIDAGAVTWGNGNTGVSGVVGAANSLVGSTAGNSIGENVTALTNGNYVVASPQWDNGAAIDAGAVTWGNGTTGVKGVVSQANSLVGSTAGDRVGENATALTNGNYVVGSPQWDNGAVTDAGAATWGSGTTGINGVVALTNSLVGSTPGDSVGENTTALTNGNYVVASPQWDNGAISDTGAVTWGSGTTGVNGVVGLTNSLIGSTAGDSVGENATALSNGNYVVGSPQWDNGAVINAGAATWGSGTTGVKGVVSPANSLVGSTAGDGVGENATALTNGNYVVGSPQWDNGAVTDAGAATWGSGTTGINGVVALTNSLVGSTPGDSVGENATALTNGNYVVASPQWDNGAISDTGAVTWGSGTTGVKGIVGSANSLVGSTESDRVGEFDATALTNGNYVVASPRWDNGAVSNTGAVTWGSGTTGVKGIISSANSLVGSTQNDFVGFYVDPSVGVAYGFVTALSNGNYVVGSPYWDNGAVGDTGAVTWGSGTTGVKGVISSANSLVGSTAEDRVGGNGGVTALANGNYVVASPDWDSGALIDAGAVTWGSGTTGISGSIGLVNSALGLQSSSGLQAEVVTDGVNGTFFGSFLMEGGGIIRVGSTTTGIGITTPIISVQDGVGGMNLVDGSAEPVNFSSLGVGVPFVKTFSIVNLGVNNLILGAISINGTNASSFVASAPGQLTLSSGASTTFTVTFTPGSLGGKSAALHIASNVTGPSNPFDINLIGSVTRYSLTTNAIGGTVTVSPQQADYAPGSVVTLTATPNPGNSFLSWSGDISGSTNPQNLTMDASKVITANFGIGLPTALDTTDLTWSGGGNGSWYGQTGTTHDTIDAAQSGVIGNSQETWTQTTVSGPGSLSFWWKVSSEQGFDFLEFTIDGVLQDRISGEVDWEQKTYPITTGTHTLRWRYIKDSDSSSGIDAGWLDQVVWTPSAADPYATWAEGFFTASQLADVSISGANADTDRDGIPNLLELILGGNPLVADKTILPVITTTTVVGGHTVVYRYNRKLAAAAFPEVVEHSTSMTGTWNPAVAGSGGVSITTAPVDAMTEQVTVTIPFTGNQGFVRLRADR